MGPGIQPPGFRIIYQPLPLFLHGIRIGFLRSARASVENRKKMAAGVHHCPVSHMVTGEGVSGCMAFSLLGFLTAAKHKLCKIYRSVSFMPAAQKTLYPGIVHTQSIICSSWYGHKRKLLIWQQIFFSPGLRT